VSVPATFAFSVFSVAAADDTVTVSVTPLAPSFRSSPRMFSAETSTWSTVVSAKPVSDATT
jgi:hypothetical protein